ncbi:hydroxyphenylacetyl-CoA thioesterase PaaI [Sneathiella sp.]|uniref:hydroxyphenylacetyl-CoA thioesterase PaaI n=1 Tax=Sneathiella sp. TaxID=1964365 RepID=UPI0039E3B998
MTDIPELGPQEVANAVSETMYKKDKAAQHLGIALKAISPGEATMTMRVTDEMLNGHNICHGGYVFTLADTAFAYACNAYNQSTVAQGAQIDFLRPVAPDSLLTATAIERSRSRQTGVYDITVTDQDDRTVALFRGNSHTIKGQMIPGLNANKEEE